MRDGFVSMEALASLAEETTLRLGGMAPCPQCGVGVFVRFASPVRARPYIGYHFKGPDACPLSFGDVRFESEFQEPL